MSNTNNKFAWSNYPQCDAEFESLMAAVDKALSLKGLKPFQRPLHVGFLFWEAFGWSGKAIPPDELADQAGFQGDVLMAKSHRWYEQTYGEQLKSPMAYGFVPVKLGNAIWRVRVPVIYGTVRLFVDRNLSKIGVTIGSRGVPATFNVLCAIEQLPQGLADRLPDSALQEQLAFHIFIHENLQWRESLPQTELFKMARNDYDASTDDVLEHRHGQARWGAQQSVEKTLKGLLTLARTPFPTGGANGHNLQHLAGILSQKHEITILPELLVLASCSAKVRYGEEPSTEVQALGANHAVLGIVDQLRRAPKTKAILDMHKEKAAEI